MRIHGLTVSVGYSDMLAVGIERWLTGLESLIVVTDHQDDATAELAIGLGAMVCRTETFYARGAKFNKAGAMQEARGMMPDDGYHLFFDADIVPPHGWAGMLGDLEPGNLYGAPRHRADGIEDVDRPDLPLIANDEPNAGYFQLFHSSDPRGRVPLDEFTHAGCYDSLFWKRWPAQRRKMLNLPLVHIGENDNWFGLGNVADFEAMKSERKRRGGWAHERI